MQLMPYGHSPALQLQAVATLPALLGVLMPAAPRHTLGWSRLLVGTIGEGREGLHYMRLLWCIQCHTCADSTPKAAAAAPCATPLPG